MNRLKTLLIAVMALLFGGMTLSPSDASAAPVPRGCEMATDGVLECTLSASNYVGWTLWRGAEVMGILDKASKKHGVRIKVRFYPNYDESMKGFNRGEAVALTVTNMDLILSQVNDGRSTEVILAGTASNGNDSVVSRWAKDIKELVGHKIALFQNSVTDWMWSMFLTDKGYKYKDFEIGNTTEDKIVAIYNSSDRVTAGTWMPYVLDLLAVPGSHVIVDSSMYPEHILDLLVVNYGTPDSVKNALLEAWFETVGILYGEQGGAKKSKLKQLMAAEAQCTVPMIDKMLKTTKFYRTPADAIEIMSSPRLRKIMVKIMTFIGSQGQLPDYESPDEVGITYPDGSRYGASDNIMVRWDVSGLKRLKK